MSKRLKISCKKILAIFVAATFLSGTAVTNYLNATTISNTNNVGRSVTIQGTTLSFGDIKKEGQGLFVDVTVDRPMGIPDALVDADIRMQDGKVEMKGNIYEVSFYIGGANKLKKVSNIQMKGKMKLTVYSNVPGVSANTITPEMLKEKNICMPIKEIVYFGKASTIGSAFNQVVKNISKVQGISLKEAGMELLSGDSDNKLKNVLPEKGLNIPICDGSRSVLDNIGFVDGKLQLRTKDPDMLEHIQISLVDQAGKPVKRIYGGQDGNGIYQFKIKDAAALAKCKFKIECGNKVIASDTEAKTFTYTY